MHKDITAYHRSMDIKRFLDWLKNRHLNKETIRQYLAKFRSLSPHTYSKTLCSLRVFCREFLEAPYLVEGFRFPRKVFNPIIAPSKEEIKRLFNAFDLKYKALLLMYCTTGLRTSKLLSLAFEDVDLEKRIVIPRKRSRTKNTWVTFFTLESEKVLKEYLTTRNDNDNRLFPMKRRSVAKTFKKKGNDVGVHLIPKSLRNWFCCEMGELGVPDRYIDAFCGRVPKSVLARHYTDYSPERLKRIYDKANLKVLD